jgi:WD40-like Beta Propeller Repeat
MKTKTKKKEITAMKKQIPINKLGSRITSKAIFALLLALGASVLLAAPSFLAAQEFSDWSPPVNLGPTVNTGFIDAGPALSKNGLSLYFNSDRPGGFGGNDIWVSHRASRECAWGAPVNLGPTINTASNEDAPSFSRDGHTMYFNSDRPGGFGLRDIYISRRRNTHNDFGWEEPVNAGPGINSAFLDAGASYFENEEAGTPLLYFGSTRPAGLFDIYVSAQAGDGSWGPAVLVPELSSPLNEQHPSVRFDGLELFLDSDRLGTFGLRDLWVSTRETTLDPWSAPVNLGATVNTTFIDQTPFIASDRETLFFASNRPGGLGNLDIYMTTREKNPHN